MKMVQFEEMYNRFLNVSKIKRKKLDIPYGFQSERQKLDIYYPEVENGPYKTIVFFHGGGFFKGDKRRYQLACALQGIDRGYAVVSVNYRFVSTNPYPAYVLDAKAAIRYLASHYKELGLDKENMIVWGESAGAYLAIMSGITNNIDKFEDYSINPYKERIDFKVIIDWYAGSGCSELKDLSKMSDWQVDMYVMQFGKDINKARELEKDAMFKNYYHDAMPALLIQHGDADDIVPLESSYQLKEEYEKFQTKVEMDVFSGFHHGVGEFTNDDNIERIFKFIEKYINK